MNYLKCIKLKAIFYSLENCKIMNWIEESFILNYLICMIKLWMGSVYMLKHNEISKYCTEKKKSVVQRFMSIYAIYFYYSIAYKR